MVLTLEHKINVEQIVKKLMVLFLGEDAPDVTVEFRKNLNRVAGLAYQDKRIIALNEQLFLHNTDKFFSSTIPHEVCHIIQAIKFPQAKQAHGPEWRRLMNMVGLSGKRFHSYDISVCTDVYQYVCSDRCFSKGIVHSVTKIIHGKIQHGQIRVCRHCEQRITYFPKGD